MAEWTAVGNAGVSVYSDFGTINRIGNKVKIWSLLDYKTVKKVGSYRFLSQMMRFEYDCEEETTRLLDAYSYSGNMRQGETVYSDANIKREAESIVPESIEDTLFKIACSKK